MAVTNVYASIRRVPIGNVSLAEKIEWNALAATPADFWLSGGYYGMDCIDDAFGSVSLEKRLQNGTTYVAVGTSTTFTSAGSVVVLLGPGIYRLAIS